MTIRDKLKYFIKDFEFLNIYTSPFKPLKLKWYVGKIKIGTPYFYPRKWVKVTPKLLNKIVLDHIASEEHYNKNNPNRLREIKSYAEIYKEKSRYLFNVPKKIGFDFVRLGWKTKWSDIDYRFEWSPVFSFVFFKWQIAITFLAPESDRYWEGWLYYSRNTDKTKTTAERIKQARKEFPSMWIRYKDGEQINVCWWDLILKDKWLV